MKAIGKTLEGQIVVLMSEQEYAALLFIHDSLRTAREEIDTAQKQIDKLRVDVANWRKELEAVAA